MTNPQPSGLRIRIANALYQDGQRPMATAAILADAVIEALDLGGACVRGGCQLRSTAKSTACFAAAEMPNAICDCLDCCG